MEAAEATRLIGSWYKSKLKELSLAQFEEWKNEKETLENYCAFYNFEARFCDVQLRKLQHQSDIRRADMWMRACEESWGWDWGSKTCKRRLGSLGHLSEAEQICIRLGVVPPTFKKLIYSTCCGPILCRDEDQVTDGSCPFCREQRSLSCGKGDSLKYKSPMEDFHRAFDERWSSALTNPDQTCSTTEHS